MSGLARDQVPPTALPGNNSTGQDGGSHSGGPAKKLGASSRVHDRRHYPGHAHLTIDVRGVRGLENRGIVESVDGAPSITV